MACSYIHFVANHALGTGRFNIPLEFRGEGGSDITTVPLQFSLAPGESYIKILQAPQSEDWADIVHVNGNDITPLPDPPSTSGGNELLDDAEGEVGIGVGPIEVEIPKKQSAHQEDASDNNQNGNEKRKTTKERKGIREENMYCFL